MNPPSPKQKGKSQKDRQITIPVQLTDAVVSFPASENRKKFLSTKLKAPFKRYRYWTMDITKLSFLSTEESKIIKS
jgi:hypothetical protein